MEEINPLDQFEDIDKIKREKYGAWKDAVTQKYVIDMLPIGQTSNAYFHRNKGVISQNIGGIDFLENANGDVKYITEKEVKKTIQKIVKKPIKIIQLPTKEELKKVLGKKKK